MGRFLNGGEHRFTRIVANHAQQLAQGNHQVLAAALFESLNVAGNLGGGFDDRLFFRMGITTLDALAARGPVFGQGNALLFGFSHTAMSHNAAQIELDFDVVFRLANLNAAADPGDGHGVSIGVQRDVSFDIHDALMKPVDLRNPNGQRFQMHPFDSKQLARNGADVFLVRRIDAVAPLPCLKIEIFPTGESASGEEVVLDEVEGPFDACRTVGISEFVRAKVETEAFSEGLHLRYGNHMAPRAVQHDDMRVVSHDRTAGAAEKTQRLGQENLAVETLERGVALKEQHSRVAQDGRCGLCAPFLSGDLHRMRGGVMLQLFTRLKLVESGSHLRLLSDAVTAAKSRQGGIGESQSAGEELLMDPDEIALAVDPLFQDLLPIRFRFLGPDD